MLKIKRRKIMIRATNLASAKKFAQTIYRKMASRNYLPEKVISVKLNKSVGLAGGEPSWNVVYRQKPDNRPRTKYNSLYKSYQGKRPRL